MEVDENETESNIAEVMLDEIFSESLQHLLNDVRSEMSPPLYTMIPTVDEFLSSAHPGPLRRGDVMEIQGPAASGKSRISQHLLASCILPQRDGILELEGWNKVAVVFDTDGTFDICQFRDLLSHRISTRSKSTLGNAHLIPTKTVDRIIDASLSRLHIFRPSSSFELAASILQLEHYLATDPLLQQSEMALLIIDSISTFYWPDRFTTEQLRVGRGGQPSEAINPFRHVVTALNRLKASHSPVVVLTNWALVVAKPSSSDGADPDQDVHYKQHLHPFLGMAQPVEESNLEQIPSEDSDQHPSSTIASSPRDESPDHAPPVASTLQSLVVNHHITLRSVLNTQTHVSSSSPLVGAADGDRETRPDTVIGGSIKTAGKSGVGRFELRAADMGC